MKIQAIYLLLIAVFVYSCVEKEEDKTGYTEPETVACFTYSPDSNIKAGTTISFHNCSEYATSINWDFGDSTSSEEENPIHLYNTYGAYEVILIAKNTSSSDTLIQTITINRQYENYIILNDSIYPISQAKILTASYRNKKRFCLMLKCEEMNFSNDTINGFGQGIRIICNGDLITGDFSIIRNSWVKAGVSSKNTAGVVTNLKDNCLKINLSNDSIELFMQSDSIEIYFKGIYTNGKYLNYPSLDELEQYVRNSQDGRATHTYAQYELLMDELSKDRYIVLPINEMRQTFDDTKVVVGLRHDVDCHPFKALEMAQIESRYGIRSSYYILATAFYYGELSTKGVMRYDCINQVYKDIYNLGCEIGIHNDLLTVMISYSLDPLQFNKEELQFYDSLGIKIYGTASHGSPIASATLANYNIFSDFADTNVVNYQGRNYPIGVYSLADFGFEYEAYFVGYTSYYSESGGRWSVTGGLPKLIEILQNTKPGKRIEILAHPVWWGK